MLLIKSRVDKFFSEQDTKIAKEICHLSTYINNKVFNERWNTIPNRKNVSKKNSTYSYDVQGFLDHLLYIRYYEEGEVQVELI